MRLTANLAMIVALAMTPAVASEYAYVTCQNGDGVSVLDLTSQKRHQHWHVSGKPAGIAVAKTAVFTVAAGSKILRKHDPKTGLVQAQVTLDGGPVGVAHDPWRNRLFVSDWYNARVWVLDASDLSQTGYLAVDAAPAGLALSKDGRYMATAQRDADQVSIFDAETLELMHNVTVGTRPFGLRFGPNGRVFVGNVGSDDLSIIEPDLGLLLTTIDVGKRPYGVAFAQGRAFVSNQYSDTLSVIDLETLAHIATLNTGEYPEGIDANSDGTQIIVANWFDNSVTIFDALSLSVIQEIETCDGPRAFGTFILGDKK
ncbi:MAG: YncE family protein [Roseobacter sp.]